eukprot:TRINITY_DN6578_c0_g1_i1.p1 TRINITY_DN6578_c0_g1~~TRINITY_DN6578_c0_g1_i1.p1  ORF type:complete len:367 (+),score=77.06 TRINITY_DN6578_c0_g1_i1:156-1256(+)
MEEGNIENLAESVDGLSVSNFVEMDDIDEDDIPVDSYLYIPKERYTDKLDNFFRENSFTKYIWKQKILFSLLVTTVVVLIGAAVFHALEDMTYGESVYFCIISFTTIGYGDFSPVTRKGRTFFVFYSVIGLLVVGYTVSVTANILLDLSSAARRELIKANKKIIDMSIDKERVKKLYKQANTDDHYVKKPQVICFRIIITVLQFFLSPDNIGGIAFISLIVALLSLTSFIVVFEEIDYLTAYYFSLVTITTIGYGDYYPITTGGRIVVCLYAIIGLGLVSILLSEMAGLIFRRQERKEERAALIEKNKEKLFKKYYKKDPVACVLLAIDNWSPSLREKLYKELEARGANISDKSMSYDEYSSEEEI